MAKQKRVVKLQKPMGVIGRPKTDLDPELIYKLAVIHCTAEEIASVFGCHRDTIYARYSDILQRGHKEGAMSLKRTMHAVAEAGDVKMLIWLSKQRCGYKEPKVETDEKETSIHVYVNEVPK